MQSHYCQFNNLSQVYVCKQQACPYPNLVCQYCFLNTHVVIEGKKYKNHDGGKFTENNKLMTQLNKLLGIEYLLQLQTKRFLHTFPTNFNYTAFVLLCTSEFFLKKFEKAKNALMQYQLLRELANNRTAIFYSSISQEFIHALTSITDIEISELRKGLLIDPPQYQYMISQINYMTNFSSVALEQFIERQQIIFTNYCTKLSENQQAQFSIQKYLYDRKNDKQNELDPVYYCASFEEFLREKYQSPEQLVLFTTIQYQNNFWKYFPFIFNGVNSAPIKKYYQHIIQHYPEFYETMKQSSIPQSLYNFILWLSINYPAYHLLAELKNHFFYNFYIYTFIDLVIKQRKINNNEIKLKQWERYHLYLNDYIGMISEKDSNAPIDINEYGPYYLFRSDKEKFVELLQNSQDVVFNRKVILSYLNQCFQKSTMPNKKKYKAFQQSKAEQQENALKQAAKQIENLKIELQEEQKESFYEYVFRNFLQYAKDESIPTTKQEYKIYREKMFEEIDEEYIKEQQEIIRAHNESKQQQMIKKEDKEITDKINEKEEQIVKKYQDQDYLSDEDDEMQLCLCCNGKPYECQNVECQIMGCCLPCTFS